MSAPASSSSASGIALALVDRMRRELLEWMRSPAGVACADSEPELDAAVTAYRAGWLAGLAAGADQVVTSVAARLDAEG